MDAALKLRIMVDDNQENISELEIKKMLQQSEIVKKLTSSYEENAYFIIWRILALAEIPYTNTLEYTKKCIKFIEETMITEKGFSPTGKTSEIVPCYNAMLLEAFCKLGYQDTKIVSNAMEWILQYQIYNSGEKSLWNGKTAENRNCLANDEPCYIGVVKSTKALQIYCELANVRDTRINQQIKKGVETILNHQLVSVLSNRMRSYETINNISFPQSYRLGIIELLEVIYRENQILDSKCQKVLNYLEKKRLKTGGWKRDYKFSGKGYISFDTGRNQGDWVTYFINKYTNL